MNTAQPEVDQAKAFLERELGFTSITAHAFARARGRCEYCGTDLLMNRQGYASAELDHLLPKSRHPEYAWDERNTALACRTCNSVKGRTSVLEEAELPEPMLDNRKLLLQRARRLIAERMGEHDRSWRLATEHLHALWWTPSEP